MNTRSSARKKSCCICFETIQYQGQIDSCAHEFCFQCIKTWVEKDNVKCPVCRSLITKVVKKQTRINYFPTSIDAKEETINVEERKDDLKIVIPRQYVMPFMLGLFQSIGGTGRSIIFE